MSHTSMSGVELDIALQQIADAEDEDNNDKVLYIRNGEIAFEDYDRLFTITRLE